MNVCLTTTNLTSGEMASWVQAIGAIVGLAVAIGIGWFQTNRSTAMALRAIKHAEQVQSDQRLDRLAELFGAPVAIVTAFIDAAEKTLSELTLRMENGDRTHANHAIERLNWTFAALAGIQPHTMPSVPSVHSILNFREQMVEITRAAKDFANLLPAGAATAENVDRLRSCIDLLGFELDDMKRELVRFTAPEK